MKEFFCLLMSAVNVTLATAFPDSWVAPFNYGVAVLCFGVALAFGSRGEK